MAEGEVQQPAPIFFVFSFIRLQYQCSVLVFTLLINFQSSIYLFCLFVRLFVCFSIWVLFHEHSRITGLQGKGEGIPVTPDYHFHPLHGHLDISREIAALASERKSLTTKLPALKSIIVRPFIYNSQFYFISFSVDVALL